MAAPVADVGYVLDPSGEIVQLHPDDVPAAIKSGYLPASPEQIKEFQLQEKYGSTGQAFQAAGLSAARALTLGASDEALVHSGAMSSEDIQGLGEANPVASGAGTAAGLIAPLVLTGGAAAPAEAAVEGGGGALAAARAASELTAPSLISSAGQAATRAVAGALPEAESLAGRIASKAISVGAGSAVEGAAYGLGQVVTEDALGDPNLTAQSALGTIGLSAALGGGLGSLLGAGEVAIPEAVSTTKDAIGNVFGQAKASLEKWYAGAEGIHGVNPATAELMLQNKDALHLMSQVDPGITETVANAPPATAASILENAPQFQSLVEQIPGAGKILSRTRADTLATILESPDAYAQLEQEFPGTLKQLSSAEPSTAEFLKDNWRQIVRDPIERARISESVRKSGQEVIESVESMFRKANGEMMKVGAKDLLADADPEKILSTYKGIWDDAAQRLADMESRPSLNRPAYSATLRNIMDDLAKDAPEALDPETAFNHLKQLRRQIGDNVDWGKRGLLDLDVRNAQDQFRNIYFKISNALKDEGVFGTAGSAQASLDAAQHAWKSVIQRRPGAMLGASEKGTSNFNFLFMQGGALSPNKMGQWFKHIADDTGALKTEAWSQFMDAARQATDAVDALHQAAPATVFDRASIASLIDKSSQLTADARQRFAATQVMDQLNPRLARSIGDAVANAQQGSAASEAVHAIGNVAGLLNNPVVNTVKAALTPISHTIETARNFPKAVAVLSSLERTSKIISDRIDTGVSTLVRGGVKAGNVSRGEISAGLAASFGKDADASAAQFSKRMADVQRLNGNPEAMHQALTDQGQDLHDHAPNTAQALSIASARGVAFLASKLPQPPQRGPLAADWTPSQAEIMKWNRYYEAVQHPDHILKQAASGTLTREAIEAVQTVYPQLFAKMQEAIVDKLSSRSAPVPYGSRLALSMLLGQDVDGSMASLPGNAATYAQAAARAAAQPMAGGNTIRSTVGGVGKVTLPKRSMTDMQATAQRE